MYPQEEKIDDLVEEIAALKHKLEIMIHEFVIGIVVLIFLEKFNTLI